jgi:uncharacterized protein YndB with AHSA1/START domain
MSRLLPWEYPELQREAANAVVHLSRTYDAPPEAVFAAWTDPELLVQWFRPRGGTSKAELDVRPGGRYRITMDPQGTLPGPGDIVGTYVEVEPPKRLVFTFAWELPPTEELSGAEDLANESEFRDALEELGRLESRVTLQLLQRDAATELTLTHEQIDTQALRAFHIFGWSTVLDALPTVL